MKRTKQQKIFYYEMPGLYEKKIKELETCEEQICWIMAKHEATRNYDNLLIFYFWRLIDDYEGQLEDDAVMGLTIPESITRARRHIQNDLGLWTPTDPDVVTAREISEDAVKDWSIRNKKLFEK